MFDTSIAGSLPKPGWLAETRKLWPQWKLQGDELRQAQADATLLWIKSQEDAGLDIVTDGEQARQHRKDGLVLAPFAAQRALPVDVRLDAVAVADVHGGGAREAFGRTPQSTASSM